MCSEVVGARREVKFPNRLKSTAISFYSRVILLFCASYSVSCFMSIRMSAVSSLSLSDISTALSELIALHVLQNADVSDTYRNRDTGQALLKLSAWTVTIFSLFFVLHLWWYSWLSVLCLAFFCIFSYAYIFFCHTVKRKTRCISVKFWICCSLDVHDIQLLIFSFKIFLSGPVTAYLRVA